MSEFFEKRYRKICPDVELDVEPRQAVRVNTKKISNKEFEKLFSEKGATVEKIPFLQHGYYIDAEFSLGATPEYLHGYYYIQSPLSQLSTEVLNPTSTTLDMAAAPGGKTTHIAQLIKEGFVVALDNNPDRLQSVINNVERMGLTNVVTVKKDARFADDLDKEFEFILLDAPCSGNFCSEENWFKKRNIDEIKKNARLQRELVTAAYRSLAPGGKFLYSTCSLEPEEDECIIDWALKQFDDLDVVPIETDIGDAGITEWDSALDPRIKHTKRFWPHRTQCEGFFIALLSKN